MSGLRRLLLESALPAFALLLSFAVVCMVGLSLVLAYCTPAEPVPAPSPTVSLSPPSAAGPAVPSPLPPAENVHLGEQCSPAGRLGYTSEGMVARCSATEKDPQLRWLLA